MAFSFTVDLPAEVDLDKALATATKEAKKNGVDFSGDTSKGKVSAKGFAGSYVITDHKMTINIDKKPFFVSENMIIDGVSDVIKNIDQYI